MPSQIATIDTHDCVQPISSRNRIKKKRDKGVKYTKQAKFVEEGVKKRNFKISLHSESRRNNYEGNTLSEYDDDDYTSKSTSTPLQIYDGGQEAINVYNHDSRAPRLNIGTRVIGSNVSNNIITSKLKVEQFLCDSDAKFQFTSDGAYWECKTIDHFFILRMWIIRGNLLVLEPIIGSGDCDTFGDYFKIFVDSL